MGPACQNFKHYRTVFFYFLFFFEMADFKSNFGRPYLSRKNSEKYESFCSSFVLKFSIQ